MAKSTARREIRWIFWDPFSLSFLNMIFPSIFCQYLFHFSFSHSCGSTIDPGGGHSPLAKDSNLVAYEVNEPRDPHLVTMTPILPLWGRMSCGPRETKYDRYNNLAKLSLNIIIHRHRYYIGLRHKNNTSELSQSGLDRPLL